MLLNGDCLIEMSKIESGSIDLVLTDLPYGVTNCSWDIPIDLELMWKELKRVCRNETPVLLFGVEPFSSKLRISNIDNFKYDWIWEKTEPTGHLNAKKQPLKAHEIVSVFYVKPPIYNPVKTTGHERKVSKRVDKTTSVYNKQDKETSYDSTERYPRTVIKFSTDKQKSKLHPTQKPVALLEYFIKTYTSEGMTVLDFTMGSGSTGVACKNLNRKFIGIEKDINYFEIAKKRLNETTKT